MKSYFLTTVLLLISLSSFAQKQECKLEKVTIDEINNMEFPADEEAEAYVMFDKGLSEFVNKDGTLQIKFIRSKKIKVLSNDGVKYAEISIPLYLNNNRDREIVKNIVAYSYNIENGEIQKTKLDKKDIFEEKINDHWVRKKFVIPNVKPGSVIEYRYILESPFKFRLPDWEFQNRIPTKHSEYTIKLVPFFEYQYILQGASKFDYFNTYKEKALPRQFAGVEFNNVVSEMIIKDIPAFRDESYITSTDDYIIKVKTQLAQINYPDGRQEKIMTTWPKLRSDLLKSENFGGFIKKSKKQAKKIIETELAFTDETPVQKAKKIIEYAKENYIWDGFYGKYANKSGKKLNTEKTANAAAINLFTIALLRAAGLQAEPMIISTRDHGKIELEYPFSDFFNFTIIRVKFEKGDMLADASDPKVAFNRLPPLCLNDLGLTINDAEHEEWLRTYIDLESTTNHNIDITPNPTEDNSKISIITQSVEYDAYFQRKKIGKDEDKLKERLLDDNFQEIEMVKIKGFDSNRLPFTVAYAGTTPLETLDEQLVIPPFFDLTIDENPLKAKTRTYPVDFIYHQSKTFNATIHIPEGYKVNYIPEDYNLDNSLITIDYKSNTTDNKIIITGTIKYKKAVYQPKTYTLLKKYISTIVEKFNDAVVLERVK